MGEAIYDGHEFLVTSRETAFFVVYNLLILYLLLVVTVVGL